MSGYQIQTVFDLRVPMGKCKIIANSGPNISLIYFQLQKLSSRAQVREAQRPRLCTADRNPAFPTIDRARTDHPHIPPLGPSIKKILGSCFHFSSFSSSKPPSPKQSLFEAHTRREFSTLSQTSFGESPRTTVPFSSLGR